MDGRCGLDVIITSLKGFFITNTCYQDFNVCQLAFPLYSLFFDLKILKLFDYVSFLNPIFVHKFLNNKLPRRLYIILLISIVSTSLDLFAVKKSGSLIQQKYRTFSYGKFSMEFQSILIRNCLHSKLHFDNASLLSLAQFKNWDKHFLFLTYTD